MKPAWLLALLAACAAGQPRLPRYTRERLPNGVVLCLAPRHDLPLVDLRVVIKGGAESDPSGLAGLSAVTADLLDEGTRRHGAGEFAAELERIGGALSTATDAQSSTVTLNCLSQYAGRGVDLLAEAVLAPAFAPRGVRKTLEQAMDYSRAVKDSPGSAAWEYFAAFFFGAEHPYGRPSWGDEVSLRRITRSLIRDYYERLYVGSNTIVVAAGDFNAAEMRARLRAAFARMPRGTPYRWLPDRPVSRPGGSRLLLVDKPDATQTNLLIGLPGIRRTHPDRLPLGLADTVLGGSFTSLLNEALRVRRGLAYGAGSWVDQNRLTGAIVVHTATPAGTTRQAFDLALDVLRRFHRDGVTAEQLATVKAYFKGTYPPENLQTSEQAAALIGELEIYGLRREEIDGLFARIDAVTLEDVNRMVRKYFDPGELYFVVVGNARSIRAQIAGYATEMVQVSIADPGFEAAPRVQVSALQHARK